LALGLAVQGIGCSTPEERHRILTIFFDGVPPLHPAEPEPVLEAAEPEPSLDAEAEAPVPSEASIHGPYADKDCEQCHSSRKSNRLKLERPALCWSCHDEEDFAGSVVHGPFAAGYCQGCHDPHRSPNPYLLVRPEADLCKGCHEQYDTEGVAGHRSDDERLCQSCHDPHASDLQYMLKGNEDSP